MFYQITGLVQQLGYLTLSAYGLSVSDWPFSLFQKKNCFAADNDTISSLSLNISASIFLLFWLWYSHFKPKCIHLWHTEPASFLNDMIAGHFHGVYTYIWMFKQMTVEPSEIWKSIPTYLCRVSSKLVPTSRCQLVRSQLHPWQVDSLSQEST